jgi:endonuclease/exonuclease/phosphatase family metal-dependent hydrolase
MSKDWGSAHYRIANYVILRDKISGKEFVVFNTHLDHVSEQARVNGIQVVLNKIAEFGGLPAMLMGDFNAKPSSETISFTKTSFDDAHDIAISKDEGATYHAWGTKINNERIDFIMLSKGDAAVSEYRILNNYHEEEKAYSSDHTSIYIKMQFN